MVRFFRYTVLLVALLFWAAGLSSTVSHWLYQAGIIVDDYVHGDLYRLSTLPQFKDQQPVCPTANRASDTASTHLYIIGDSFTEPQRISQSDFSVSRLQRVKWDNLQRAQLDPTKRNVLLLETVERHFRQIFARPVRELIVETDTSRSPAPQLSWRRRLGDDIHMSDIEERLESSLFSRDWAFWFKELKASFTLRWFNRWSTGVSLSSDQRHIYLHSDTDTTNTLLSSFSRLPDSELNTLIDSVNSVADRYRQLGFDEVYLSIIPNKATIVGSNPGVYNHLIERVQHHPALRVRTVDAYTPFKQSTTEPYLLGDTHWNCTGRGLWLAQVWQTIRL